MLKEEAKKSAPKEENGIELSSSPFEQKFSDLRPTISSTSHPSLREMVCTKKLCLLQGIIWLFWIRRCVEHEHSPLT